MRHNAGCTPVNDRARIFVASINTARRGRRPGKNHEPEEDS